jgi:hypothetical protein
MFVSATISCAVVFYEKYLHRWFIVFNRGSLSLLFMQKIQLICELITTTTANSNCCLLIPVFLVSTFESSSEENLSTILCGYVFQFPRAYSSAVCIKVSWMLIRFKSTGARLTSPPSTARNGPHWTLQVFLFWTIRITIRKVKTRPCLRVSDTRTIQRSALKRRGESSLINFSYRYRVC